MEPIQRLLQIMQALRDPEGGCPWDRAQTFQTIVPHTLEVAYEAAVAIERGDMADIRDELGDLLFQVVFYAQLGKEQGEFDFDAIATAIAEKLERRHPHVFGDRQYANTEEQNRHWEELKAEERADKSGADAPSVLDGITPTLPALSLAHKLQKRAAQVGFDWPDHQGVLEKVQEEIAEVQQAWVQGQAALQEEIGDLLFSCVNLARHAGVDSETALRQANRKFSQRFRAVESQLAQTDTPLGVADIATMEAAWCKAKQSSTPETP